MSFLVLGNTSCISVWMLLTFDLRMKRSLREKTASGVNERGDDSKSSMKHGPRVCHQNQTHITPGLFTFNYLISVKH